MSIAENIKIIRMYSGLLPKLYLLIRHIEFPPSLIESVLPKKGVIADLGCGFGSYAIYYGSKCRNRKILGLELNKNRVEAARKAGRLLKNVQFQQRDFNKTTELNKYETILIVDLLHHIPRATQNKLLIECRKKLKKNGLLIIKEVNTRLSWKYYYNYFQDKVMTRNDKLFFIKEADMINNLKKQGFRKIRSKVLESWPMNPIPHILYVCRK